MASDVDTLLHDVLVFMQQLLQQQALPPDSQDELRALVARLRQADGAYRPSYLAMNGTLSLRRLHPGLGELATTLPVQAAAARLSYNPPCPPAEPQSPPARWSDASAAQDDTDSGVRMRTTSADSGDLDTSADCSECLDDSNDDWPPRGAPTCLRPDLSPDWAVSAAAARALALHCGAVYRAAPGRWFRRRGWAALLPAPARLLVFSGARSSRPRLVLLLAPLAPAGAPDAPAPLAPCCDPCCAVYAARPRQQGPAFELCCPGRKTHQLWVSDEKEAQDWVEAIRRAPQQQPEQPSTSAASSPSPPLAPAPAADGDSHGASDGSPVGVDPSARSGSRSVLFVGETLRASSAEAQAPQDGGEAPDPPPPAPEDLQQEYESMMAGSEEIYHDIGSPEPAAGACPSYANMQLHPGATSMVPGETADAPEAEVEDPDDQTKPDLYDDVVAHPHAPEYCNVGRDEDEEEHAMGEHLYDDIGPTETRASVYELIQDPNQVISQGIRCS